MSAVVRNFVFYCCLAVLFGLDCSGQTVELFVSPKGNDKDPGSIDRPFATVDRARQAVRDILKKGTAGDIVVNLRGGEFQIDEPLVFDEKDSPGGSRTVTFRAYNDEKPLISGGRTITGWRKIRGTVWSTDITAQRDERGTFRQLFRDGARLPRCRYPDGDGMLTIAEVSPDQKQITLREQIPFLSLKPKAEIIILQNWNIARILIDSLSEGKVFLQNEAGWMGHCCCVAKQGMAVFFENSPEFLTEPGEWYLDESSRQLYYAARDGEDPNTKVFVAPFVDKFLIVRGKPDVAVQNLRFNGIDFAYTNFSLPAFGYRGLQAGFYGTSLVPAEPEYCEPAAIEFTDAENCFIDRCTIAHTGAAGVGFGRGTRKCRVTDSEIYDNGGNGINIGHRTEAVGSLDEDWPRKNEIPTGNEIVNNYVHDCGATQFGAVGIFAAFCSSTTVSHNTVAHLPYTGISVGFRWNPQPSSMERCTVEANDVFDVMKILADGGCIYTLGLQPGTIMKDNLLHDVHRSKYAFGGAPNNAFFFDEGTTGLRVEGNISFNTSGEPIRFNQSKKDDQSWGVNYFNVDPADNNFPKDLAAKAGGSLFKKSHHIR
ncbi:MAG: right-handed parallel beta-helix repeat-containing protein [Bacteroidota bacterium]|jgi:hypothetical protein